jgi:hypothetical protein
MASVIAKHSDDHEAANSKRFMANSFGVNKGRWSRNPNSYSSYACAGLPLLAALFPAVVVRARLAY